MSALAFPSGGVRLRGFDLGAGPATLFQHGLGGDEAQVAEAFPSEGRRRLTLECRAHGRSEPGDPRDFSIARFADDVLAFADSRGVARFAVGGISMGAAIALRIAATRPERVDALVLARPAWGWAKAPANMRPFAEAARGLAGGGRAAFAASATARMLARDAPDNLASLLGFFDRPNLPVVATLLASIAIDGPGVGEAEIRAIAAPTLVLGAAMDYVHPVGLARELAGAIPSAGFVEVASKAKDKARHFAELRAAIDGFLASKGY